VFSLTRREFDAVSTEFDASRAGAWVRANVLPKLPPPADRAWRSRQSLRADLLEFLTSAPGEVQLWAWIAAYDHVALCQLWGAMPALPRALPRFTRELRQRWEDAGRPPLPPPTSDAHDALAREVRSRILEPTLSGLLAEGITFRGVIYVGLMMTAEGPQVLEYNVRFGDPETQAILPRLEGLVSVSSAFHVSWSMTPSPSRPRSILNCTW
jgi:hypothetical protein